MMLNQGFVYLSPIGLFVNDAVERGIIQPLLIKSEAKQQDEDGDEELDDDDESTEGTQKPVTSIVSAYRLLTPSVKVYNLILGLI